MRSHLCGIQSAWTEASDVREAVASVAALLDREPIGHLLVFFSPAYDARDLVAAVGRISPA